MSPEEFGVLKQQVKSLEKRLTEYEDKMDDQEALVNKGRGAVILFLAVGSIATLLMKLWPGG